MTADGTWTKAMLRDLDRIAALEQLDVPPIPEPFISTCSTPDPRRPSSEGAET